MKWIFKLYLIGFLFFTQFGFAQTSNLGQPYTMRGKVKKTKNFYTTPAVDVAFERQQNALNASKMYRFGKEFQVDVNVLAASEKFTLPSGDVVHQYGVSCPNALSVNLIFKDFHLAPGAKLFIVDEEGNEFIGAHTSFNNNVNNMLGTDLIHSSKIIIELVEPQAQIGNSRLSLGTIVHGFEDLESLVAKALNDSGNCHYDVNCPQGAAWINQTKSVGMMVNGGGFCTGALVNNTSGTVIPYFLSANHCGTNPGGWVFRFRWESPAGSMVCGTGGNSGNGPENMNVNGGILRAAYAGSDVTLTELNTAPNPTWGIYYSGWDNSNSPVSSAVGIHHPSGDIKKISFEDDPLTNGSWPGSPAGSHWHVPGWDLGVTEPGSSGSPLFDQNHRVIGQLHGGASACGASDLSDEYGKFSLSWTGNNTSATRLKDWLDPGNTGATTVEGYDPLGPAVTLDASLGNAQGVSGTFCGITVSPQVTITNFGTDLLTSATVSYGYDGVLNQTYNWSGSLSQFQNAVITLPTVTLSGGNHTFDANILNANGSTDQNNMNNQITSTFNTVVNGQTATLNLTLDCWGSEISWNLFDTGGNSLYSGSGYTDNSAGLVQESFCLSDGCYTLKIDDSYGDGLGGQGCSGGSGSYNITYNSQIVAGLTAANADFGSTNSQNFCINSGANVGELDMLQQLVIYPNPATNEFSIVTNGAMIEEVMVYAADGRLIHVEQAQSSVVSIASAGFTSGLYFVQVTTGDVKQIKQLLIK